MHANASNVFVTRFSQNVIGWKLKCNHKASRNGTVKTLTIIVSTIEHLSGKGPRKYCQRCYPVALTNMRGDRSKKRGRKEVTTALKQSKISANTPINRIL